MPKKTESVPEEMRPVYESIVGLTNAVCKEHLSEEYAGLARKLAAALARKRPSPLARGKSDVWACGIVYALGTVNFLFDASQKPHVRADELCRLFGVSASTASAKAKTIRDLFKMYPFDPHWSLPSNMDRNPMAWLIQVNGFIVDARSAPREIQEEAFRKGLIPYLPGEPRSEDES